MHFSSGAWTRDWLDSVEAYSAKWHSVLPLSIYPLTKQEISQLEYLRFVRVSNFLLNEGKRYRRGVGYALRAIVRRPLEIENYKKLLVFLLGPKLTARMVTLKKRF